MRAMTAAHWNADDDFTLGSDTTNDTLAEYRPEDLDEEYNFELKVQPPIPYSSVYAPYSLSKRQVKVSGLNSKGSRIPGAKA